MKKDLQNIIQKNSISVKLFELIETAFEKFSLNIWIPISVDHN